MSKIIDGIVKDLKAIPETLKAKTAGVDKKKLILMNLPYILAGYFCDNIAWLWRVSPGSNASDKMMAAMNGLNPIRCRAFSRKICWSVYFYVYNPIEKLSLKGYNYNVCIVQLKMTHSVFRFVIGGV